jgi:hypothetical protein
MDDLLGLQKNAVLLEVVSINPVGRPIHQKGACFFELKIDLSSHKTPKGD